MTRGEDEIVDIGFDYRSLRLTLACPRCGTRHAAVVPSVIMVARPACPDCGHTAALEPDAIAAACRRLMPPLTLAAGDATDLAVAELVRRWPAAVEGDALLAHAGVDLGAGAAFALMPVALRGYLAATDPARSDP
jgi:hypothetical protein